MTGSTVQRQHFWPITWSEDGRERNGACVTRCAQIFGFCAGLRADRLDRGHADPRHVDARPGSPERIVSDTIYATTTTAAATAITTTPVPTASGISETARMRRGHTKDSAWRGCRA